MSELIDRITKGNDKERADAWFHAGEIGAAAIRPLADTMGNENLEVARAAKRGMWQVVRHAGRPGAGEEKRAVVAELVPLLGKDRPEPLRREVLWMLSEIGGDESVDTVAALLVDEKLREDARCALERIPGDKSLEALQAALAKAPDDFKGNLAQSIRARGVEVPGVPCRKMVPTKQTGVKPVG